VDGFIDEDGRNETSKYFFSEACEVADQKTTLHSYQSKQDQHDPETNPTTPWQKFHMIYSAKLKCNNKQIIKTFQLSTNYHTTQTTSFIKGQSLGKLTGCEDKFVFLVWPSERKFFLLKKFS